MFILPVTATVRLGNIAQVSRTAAVVSNTQQAVVHAGRAKWQTQALAAPSASNAQLEGDDPTTTPATPTVRLGNLCQISYKVARVSGTQQAVDRSTMPVATTSSPIRKC